jgi:SAM-dependent methyltransferase
MIDAARPRLAAIPRRLDFRLPDFTRYAWVSEGARERWEPRIRRITEMLLELEWRTIAEWLRPCALRNIPVDQLETLRASLAPDRIEVETLQPTSLGTTYSSTLEAPAAGVPSAYWSALGRRDDLDLLCEAYRGNDQREVGRLLGYPPCCVEFFEEIWVRHGMVDTTWPMAVATVGRIAPTERHVEIPGPSNCGMQLRWLGVRQVFHLPCSFDCKRSSECADLVANLAARRGYDEELAWLDDMLRWPVEWTALHGIAEIKTPVVKIVTRTDATPDKYVVTYRGDGRVYPDQGAAGLAFPFRAPAAMQITLSRAFRDGLENPIVPVEEPAEFLNTSDYFRDNGFSSRYAMDRSHRPILDLARDVLGAISPSPGDRIRVLDLGCGNGALVRKIAELHPGVVPAGIDLSPDKIARARRWQHQFEDEFRVANLFDAEALDGGEIDITILMLGRLIEVPMATARQFLERLRDRTRHLLVYAYDDYIRQFGPLASMAAQVGIRLLDPEPGKNLSLAEFDLVCGSNEPKGART